MRDSWCIGFTDDFILGVWVGNFSGEPIWDVSGMTGSVLIWSEIMKNIYNKDKLCETKNRPEGLVLKNVNQKDVLNGTKEWFIKGTGPDPKEIYNFSKTESKNCVSSFWYGDRN